MLRRLLLGDADRGFGGSCLCLRSWFWPGDWRVCRTGTACHAQCCLLVQSGSVPSVFRLALPSWHLDRAFWLLGAIFLAKDVWTLAGDPNWLETPTFPGECTVGGCCRVTVSLPHRAENLEPLLVKNTPMATVRDELHRWVDPGKINWQEDCEWRGSLLLTGGSAEGAVPSEVRKLAVANCRSLSWKFVDDMAWQLSDVNCTDGSTGVLVEMHSQQRVGMDDGRHNFYRVAFCYAFLTDRFANLAVPFNGSSC